MPIDTILPPTPFDGQIFLDVFKIKWVYRAEDDLWVRVGVAVDVPVARPEGDPLGPTNGLFSAKYKALLDSLSPKAGGFGIILRPGYYLTDEHGVENVLTGDVTLVSESLKISCVSTGITGDCTPIPTLQFGLSQDFIDAYAIEILGQQGPKGPKGPKGQDGRPGTGDGPQGEPGANGKDATVPAAFGGVIYNELDAIYDTAVVGLRLDANNGILEVTKAKMNVPGDSTPATRVIATPLSRGIEFTSADMSKWQLNAPSDDVATVVDLDVIRLPKGWAGSTDPVPVMPIRLSEVVQSIINYYNDQATTIINGWDDELKNWIIPLDTTARTALQNLATQVADCEFQAPLELCLGLSPSDCGSVLNVRLTNTPNQTEGTGTGGLVTSNGPWHPPVGGFTAAQPNQAIHFCPYYKFDTIAQQDKPAVYTKSFYVDEMLNCQVSEGAPNGATIYGKLRFAYGTGPVPDRFVVIGNGGRVIFDNNSELSVAGGLGLTSQDLVVYDIDNPITVTVYANSDGSQSEPGYQFEMECLAGC